MARALRAVKSAPTLVDSVRSATAAMPWLGPSDQAMVELALRYAQTIEDAVDLGPVEAAKTVGWMGPHLANAIKALGGTPAERQALGVEEAVRGRLAELRAARKRNTEAVDPSA